MVREALALAPRYSAPYGMPNPATKELSHLLGSESRTIGEIAAVR